MCGVNGPPSRSAVLTRDRQPSVVLRAFDRAPLGF
jgi:hypothetical protein